MGYIISSKVENYFVGTVSQMYILANQDNNNNNNNNNINISFFTIYILLI